MKYLLGKLITKVVIMFNLFEDNTSNVYKYDDKYDLTSYEQQHIIAKLNKPKS